MSFNYSSNFEEIVMRWRYIQRAKPVSDDRLLHFEKHATEIAKRYFWQFSYAFNSAGYDLEDVKSLAMVYLLSYLGNFSIEDVPARAEKVIPTLKNQSDENIAAKNIADMTLFIRQRLMEAANYCSLKSQGFYADEIIKAYFIGPENSNLSDEAILGSPEVHGFKKITYASFKKLKKQNQIKRSSAKEIPIGDGKVIRSIVKLPASWLISDSSSSENETTSPTSINTDVALTEFNTEIRIDREIEEFEQLDDNKKLKILKDFIKKNKGNWHFKKEMSQARKQIKAILSGTSKVK